MQGVNGFNFGTFKAVNIGEGFRGIVGNERGEKGIVFDAARSLEHRDLTRRRRGTEEEGEEDIERDLRAVLRAQGRVVISGEGEGHEGGVS